MNPFTHKDLKTMAFWFVGVIVILLMVWANRPPAKQAATAAHANIVVAPNGKSYRFPNKTAADDFKEEIKKLTKPKARDFTEGLVTEYNETVKPYLGYPERWGHFTVRVGNVDYWADESADHPPVPIVPGSYQVYTGTLNYGSIEVVVPRSGKNIYVLGEITEARIVNPKMQYP
jgi:hypothetical protein